MSFLSAGSSSAGAHPQPAANRYEIQAFFSFHLLIKSAVGGMQALHRSEGGWPRAPVLLPFRHKFHDTKGTALAGGCCVQRGWPAVDHWQEPGKAHCRSHSERRFQDDSHAWTAPGQQESASYRRLGEIRPHTVPRPRPSWLHAWMDPGLGLSNLHSCMWQTWPSS